MDIKLKKKIERQNRNTNKKMTMYVLGMKSTTRIIGFWMLVGLNIILFFKFIYIIQFYSC